MNALSLCSRSERPGMGRVEAQFQRPTTRHGGKESDTIGQDWKGAGSFRRRPPSPCSASRSLSEHSREPEC